jgi:D-glycero-beta-D-manno-heptose-7-phosphate kinase
VKMWGDLIGACSGKRILVVGDVMLDEYIMGHVGRISPEAPVPVVEIRQRRFVPGGAANTAANVAGLGGTAMLLGVVGDDVAATHLRRALGDQNVATEALIIDHDRPTTTKTRIIAHSQQVARLDQEDRRPLADATIDRLVRHASTLLSSVDACVISDYAKGLVSDRFAKELIAGARGLGIPVVVDPKGTDFAKYRGATVVKPNLLETEQVLNCRLNGSASVLRAGEQLLDLLPGTSVLITRGAQGMSVFIPDKGAVHIPAEARDVFDVTGAGDTVAAALCLVLAGGGTLEQAARLATRAAAIVVAQVGTTAVRLQDVLASAQA